jgi:hypothetical protein
MVSKCANPACAEKFLCLHEREISLLSPTPEVEAATGAASLPLSTKDSVLGDRRGKRSTLNWGGTEVKLIPLATPVSSAPAAREQIEHKQNAEARCRTVLALE